MTFAVVPLCLCAFVSLLVQSAIPDIDALRRAVERDPADVEARRNLGHAYFRDRQHRLTLEQYQEAIRLQPMNENLYLEAAAIYLAIGPEQAESVLVEARRRFPNSISPKYNVLYHDLAELWANHGRLRKASEALRTGIRYEGPVAPSTLYKRIGDFETDLLRFDEALSAYARALEFDDRNPATHLALGNLHLRRNSAAEALNEFRRVISLDSRNTNALYGVAEANRRMGRLSESIASAEKALAISPSHAGARYIRGTVLARMGRTEEARRELETYRTLQTTLEAESHRKRRIQTFAATGMSRLLERRYDDAIAVFKEAVAVYPDVAELHFNLGLAQSQSGQHRAAVETYLDLIDRKLGMDTLVHRYLAQEYKALGDVEAAKRHDVIYLQKREAELAGPERPTAATK